VRGWDLPESPAAPLLTGAGAWPGLARAAEDGAGPSAPLYHVARNERYTVERDITDKKIATS
jgi:hypothetical protein